MTLKKIAIKGVKLISLRRLKPLSGAGAYFLTPQLEEQNFQVVLVDHRSQLTL
jgi:hypothetical protein